MISKKEYTADGVNNRFLSDFIIQSEQFARPYVYIYDNTLDPNGTEDVLQDPGSPWSYPDNLYRRGAMNPVSSEDLLTVDKWDLVDNSILTYETAQADTQVWIEVATTPEEFGDTLTAPSVERAEDAADRAAASEAAASVSETNAAASETQTGLDLVETNQDTIDTAADVATTNANVLLTNADVLTTGTNVGLTNADVLTTGTNVGLTNADVVSTNADVVTTGNNVALTNADVVTTNANVVAAGTSETNSQLSAWESEAERLTGNSYAIEPEDIEVKHYTSNGNGTFTSTPQTGVFSSLHYSKKSEGFADSIDPATLVKKTDYATSTVGGAIKARLAGTDAFITFDGTDA